MMATVGNEPCMAKSKDHIVLTSKRGRGGVEKKAHWSDDDKRIFLDLCIEQVREGRRPNTSFDKCGWQEIAKAFNEKNNTNWDIEQFKSLYRYMRGSWVAWKHLCQKSSGWGWCHETQRVDPPSKEHWNDFIKRYKHGAQFKYGSFKFIKQCEELYSRTSSEGNGSCCPDLPDLPSNSVEQVAESLLVEDLDATHQPSALDDDDDTLPEELENALKKQKASGSGKQKQKKEVSLDTRDMLAHFSTMAQVPVAAIPVSGQSNDSVTLALKILDEIEDIPSDSDLYIEALQVLEDPVKREFFLKMIPSVRSRWLRSVISKMGRCPSV